MLRSQIPAAVAKARAADIDRIPLAALAKMAPADVSPRLLAADEMRRRAFAHGQPADLARMYSDLASEVLTTADPKRAGAIMKTAGITTLAHEPMIGTHTHEHTAFGVPGDDDPTHEHEHTHDGDAVHRHFHATKAAKAAGPVMSGALRKAAPTPAQGARSVTVPTPALDDLADSRSFHDGLTKLARAGRLGQAAKELALVADAKMALDRGVESEPDRYAALADQVTDPAMRDGYAELAAKARQKVRAAWA